MYIKESADLPPWRRKRIERRCVRYILNVVYCMCRHLPSCVYVWACACACMGCCVNVDKSALSVCVFVSVLLSVPHLCLAVTARISMFSVELLTHALHKYTCCD